MINILPVYTINLDKRIDRRRHIFREFEGRDEFNINIVAACEHENGAIGLWHSIKYTLLNLVREDDDFIILCEDDHRFTEHYSKDILYRCIKEAMEKDADILCGGVSWFKSGLQVSENLFWIERFSGLQFTVIFKQFYQKILEADFGANDAADYKISDLSDKKFVIHPFVSIQKEFGYSDVTSKNNGTDRVENLFQETTERFSLLKKVRQYYFPL